MKTLSTEQQTQLQKLLADVTHDFSDNYPSVVQSELAFWAEELKPKRVRKKTEKELAGFSAEHVI